MHILSYFYVYTKAFYHNSIKKGKRRVNLQRPNKTNIIKWKKNIFQHRRKSKNPSAFHEMILPGKAIICAIETHGIVCTFLRRLGFQYGFGR